MAADTEPLEGSVFKPHHVRMLKIAVIVMGILIFAGMAVLVAGLMHQASKAGKRGAVSEAALPAAGGIVNIKTGKAAGVKAVTIEAGLVAVHLQGPEGNEILLIDGKSGRLISRIVLNPE